MRDEFKITAVWLAAFATGALLWFATGGAW